MADKKTSIRKKPVSQKRVATVLASLVGALTLSAAALLLMDGGSGSGVPLAMGVEHWSLAEQLQTRVPLQSGAWNCIIIYESGDQAGDAAALADGFLNGEQTPHPVRPKADFHFVIDSARSPNGTDGWLETGTAWREQKVGVPYAGWPDVRYHNILSYHPRYKPVGVCFIGDLDRKPISEAQHRTLVQLVRELQDRLNIDKKYVYFQWQLESNVPASQTQKEYADFFRNSLK
ncbi:MAG: hypothetical protein FWD61_13580 [Phycisphaerales bacterium]|nr:hypothetical protein [Phycisphaerales bacterium]